MGKSLWNKGKQSVLKYGSIALFFTLVCVVLICVFSKTILFFLNHDLVFYYKWLQLFSVWLFFIVINNLIGYHYLNGLNKSSIFRNVNIIYTLITVSLMIFGSYYYSFKGCICAVLFGEIFLTGMLVYKTNDGKKAH